MSSKRIVVCCDGTWNDADSAGEFTNVVRMARAILPIDGRGGKETAQIVYYESGVGTGADLVGRVLGGGVGLSIGVQKAPRIGMQKGPLFGVGSGLSR